MILQVVHCVATGCKGITFGITKQTFTYISLLYFAL
jgi:hypothetical protein